VQKMLDRPNLTPIMPGFAADFAAGSLKTSAALNEVWALGLVEYLKGRAEGFGTKRCEAKRYT
jgi:hypothetical protein